MIYHFYLVERSPMISGRYAPTLLFLGDILVFFSALWLTLFVRYAELPGRELFESHLPSFSLLFLLWLLVFYMAGLYGKRVVLFKSALFGIIVRTQLANIVLAALFFFLVPNVGIAPKTNLFLYLIVSLALILFWRLWLFPRFSRPSSRERAALIASGEEAQELAREINGNPRYHLTFPVVASPEEIVREVEAFSLRLSQEQVTLLVVDTTSESLRPLLPRMYELTFVRPGYAFADFHELYEEVFDRVPLSLLQYDWFLRNASDKSGFFYPVAKRVIDIIGGSMMGLVTLIILPLVALAVALERSGPVFIRQERLGRYGTRMQVLKFRTMRFATPGHADWVGERGSHITPVGAFLRRTSLDEFPQFWNVLKGEMSLVGPRNDLVEMGIRLGKAISYYDIRYIVPPGITGWAQINQQYEQGNISPQSIEETKVRLAYDFYYIKHRSLALDIIIALKTFKRMLFRVAAA